MDNQHRIIKGYRDLTEKEIELINLIKKHGDTTKSILDNVGEHLRAQAEEAKADINEADRISLAQPARWLAIARTDFQTAYMALVRAAAQPGSF